MAKTRYELFEQGLIRKYKDVAELAPEARQMGQKAAVVLKEPGWSPHNIRDIYLYGGGAYVSYYVNPTEFKGDKSISFASGKLEGEDKRPLLNVLYKMSNLSALVSNLQSIIIFVDKTKGRIRTLEEGNPDAFYVAMPDGSYSCSPSDVWNGIGGKEYVAMLTKTSTCNDVDVRFVDISDGFFTFKAEKGIADDKRFLLSRVKAAKLAIAEDINRHFFVPLGVDALNMRLDGDKHVWAVVEDAVRDKTSTFKLDETANAKISKLLSGAKAFDTDVELKAHIVGNRTFTAKTVETAANWNGRELNSDFVTQFGGCLQTWTSNTTVYPVDAKLLDTYEQEVRKPYDALCYATAELQSLGITADTRDDDDAVISEAECTREYQFSTLQSLFKQLSRVQKSATTDKAILHFTEDALMNRVVAALCSFVPVYEPEIKEVYKALRQSGEQPLQQLAAKFKGNAQECVTAMRAIFGYFCKYYLLDQAVDYDFIANYAARYDAVVGELSNEQQNILEECIFPLLYAFCLNLIFYIAFINYVRLDIIGLPKLPTTWLNLRSEVCRKVLDDAAEANSRVPKKATFKFTDNAQKALVSLFDYLNKDAGMHSSCVQEIDTALTCAGAIFKRVNKLKPNNYMVNMRVTIEIMQLSLESGEDGGSTK